MKYLVIDASDKEIEVEADRVEVSGESERVAFWQGEVIVAMFWDLKSFRQADE